MNNNVTKLATIVSFTLTIFVQSVGLCQEAPRNPALTSPAKKLENEDSSWTETKKTNKESLKSFLSKFPQGKYAETARTLVLLLDKMDSIRAGKSAPAVAIGFDKLMPTWKD